jgi:DNA repair exonuclease SbcCD ATPase subunit
MLILKEMRWTNAFSYGEDNYIKFNKEPLTQLVGPNGAGKTSISLMLQEVLYGKNNKNIKKQDITNNKSGKKGYYIVLSFEKDGEDYIVELDRKSNLKFKLFKNGTDISSHTSLNTYKTLNNIIGIEDFKIFCQLIYQHSTDSLDFLTATDTNRKKFLISLLQLDRYMDLHEFFKDKVRSTTTEVTQLQGSISVIEAWINRHKDMDFIKRSLEEVPEIDGNDYARISKLKKDILNINSINKKIVTNNGYKKQLSQLDSKYYMGSAPAAPSTNVQELRTQLRILEKEYNSYQQKINKLNAVSGECPTCLQEINQEIQNDMIDYACMDRDAVKRNISALWEEIPKAEAIETEILKYTKEKAEFERLNQLIDNKLPVQTLDLNEMKIEKTGLEEKIKYKELKIKEIEKRNLDISAHNSKVDVIKNQLDEMKRDLKEKDFNLIEKENLNNILELLKKTFSTNGLVSYKIESSVKELEKEINKYLADLTYFQIYFKLSGEKLNIEVVDDIGNITSISNLSSGERARVNIATILAIRKILSSLTSTKINLLFLDEVIGVIDAEGKEKLSEILLQENLNTFIVSHDWTHPLIPRINIIKEHHISRIEND